MSHEAIFIELLSKLKFFRILLSEIFANERVCRDFTFYYRQMVYSTRLFRSSLYAQLVYFLDGRTINLTSSSSSAASRRSWYTIGIELRYDRFAYLKIIIFAIICYARTHTVSTFTTMICCHELSTVVKIGILGYFLIVRSTGSTVKRKLFNRQLYLRKRYLQRNTEA